MDSTHSQRFITLIIDYLSHPFLTSLFLMMYITFDQILVKHFFSSAEAGFYAAAGMIAKIIWFGSGFFVYASFPKIASLTARGKDASRILVKSIAYTSILAAIGISFYFIMPAFIVNVFYGNKYLAIAPLIGVFGIAMGLFSLIQILAVYNLAVERFKFIWIILTGFIAEAAGIFLFHNTLVEVINILLGVNILVLIGMLIFNKKQLGAR